MTDIIERVCGKFGVWQLRSVLIIFLCKIPASWFMACIIFTAPAPRDGEIACSRPPQYSHLNRTEWIGLAHPVVKAPGINRTRVEYCYVNASVYHPGSTEHGLTECTEFDHYTEHHSLVQQFDLVCDKDILIALTQFFHLFGILVGGVTGTLLMDYISPKHVMLLGMFTQIVCGILTGYAQTFPLHVFFRCLSAVCCALMFTAGAVIFTGITAGKYRVGVNILYDEFWSIGVIMLPGLASYFHSWIHLYIAISLPTLILIFLYPWIPDAPLWHLKRGHIEKVQRILLEAAEINEREYLVPENLEEILKMKADEMSKEPPPAGWWSLWKGPNMITIMIAAHVAWAVYVTNFMGMLLNIRSFSREYLSQNTIITGASEMVGCFMALLFTMHTKRKWMWAGVYNVVAGGLGFLGWILPDEVNEILRVSLWMIISSIAKAGVSITQSMLMGCNGELVPLRKRQIFTFSCVTFARVWLLTAPFINVLKVIDTAMSLSFFCLLQLIGGICTIVLQCQVKSQNKGNQCVAPIPNLQNNEKTNNSVSSVWTTVSDYSERTTL